VDHFLLQHLLTIMETLTAWHRFSQ
jgi:hypothetical protein